jgi:hypothetical protein
LLQVKANIQKLFSRRPIPGTISNRSNSQNEPAMRTLTLFGQVNGVRGFFFLTLLFAAIRKMFGTKG